MGAGGCCSANKKVSDALLKEERNVHVTPRMKRKSTHLHLPSINATTQFYGNVVVSCTGKNKDGCASTFSKLVLNLVVKYRKAPGDDSDDDSSDSDSDSDDDNKSNKRWNDKQKRTIKGSMISLRSYFYLLLENTENDIKYSDLYDKLTSGDFRSDNKTAIFILNQFVLIIRNNDQYLLQCLANYTCTLKSRELWNEISQNVKDNPDLQEQSILSKVDEIKTTTFYSEMFNSGIHLDDNEIIALYVYTVNVEFADLLQKHFKIPCKWKQTFYYLVRGVFKVYEFKVYKKATKDLPSKLYHPVFGVDVSKQILSPINCTSNDPDPFETCSYFVFNNCNTLLSNGDLIGIPLDWISHEPQEKEWILLPLIITEYKKSNNYDDDKQHIIQKYKSFPSKLYGVDIFFKCKNLQFIQDLNDDFV